MKVVSLFDGLGGARLAFDLLGVYPELYFASEIDSYAIQIAHKNYPDIIHIGNVKELNRYVLPKNVDILIGGSPCFIAGTQIKMENGKVKSIEEIRVGDMVITHNFRARKVLKTMINKSRDLYLIGYKVNDLDHSTLVTGDHPYYVRTGTTEPYWKKIRDINPIKDRIIIKQGSQMKFIYLDYKKSMNITEDKTVYNFEVEEDNSYIANSCLVHNCQSLSICKRQKESGLEKGESTLFWEYVRIKNILNPKYFLLENVASMKSHDRDRISQVMGVEPIMINSSLLTAQQRKRLYWTNIPNVELPEDQHIYLKDILESNTYTEKLKSYCITATYSRAGVGDYFNHGQRQLVFNSPVRIGQIGKGGQGDRIYHVGGKSICLSANGGGRGAKTGLYEIEPVCLTERRTEEAKQIRKEHREKYGKDFSPRRGKELVARTDGKSNCLTTGITKEHYVASYNEEDMKPFVRKLTPLECERLQGIHIENYTKGVSDSQRYKMIGNGFTIPVIAHILSYIPEINDWRY